MTAPLLAMADAVVDTLNNAADGTFNQVVRAERRYTIDHSLEDLAALQVSVLPRNRDEGIAARRTTVDTLEIDIGVQKRIDPEDMSEGDAMMELSQQIADHFRFRKLNGATWLSSNMRVPYDGGHMRENRVFTTVITLTYRLRRSA